MRLTRVSRSFRVPPHARVLDIGAGDSPFAPADVVCEKFPWDDRERTAPFRQDRPLVVGDIETLPFRDKAFDFVFCSHVLEHTFHPQKAMEELMRIAHAGYIEVPSSYLEKASHSTPSHIWFIRREKDTLVFSPKSRGVLDPEIDAIFKDRLLEKDPLYTAFHYARFYDLFNISLFWKDQISFRIEQMESQTAGTTDQFDKGSSDWSHGDSSAPTPARRVPWIKRWVRRRAMKAKPGFTLQDVIACPFCKKPFANSVPGTSLTCASCRKTFPMKDQVPVLLPEAALTSTS